MRPSIGARSDVGRVRDGNEDSYLVQEPLFVVADGMGGHVAGDVASRLAVETIGNEVPAGTVPDLRTLESAVKEANLAIWERAQSEPALQGMGTTCTLVLVVDDEARIAHVGDSRAYLLRDGKLEQITEDHTLVARMVKEGRLSAEEADHHPQRSIVTRALGVDSEVAVDTTSVALKKGDRLLVCSDGLTSMIGTDQIREVLAGEPDPQSAADRLVDLANQAGGEDNITVVALLFDGGATGKGAAGATTTKPPADASARTDEVQPGARAGNVTGAFQTPPEGVGAERPGPARPRTRRRSRPILAMLVLLAIVLVAGALVFRYAIVESSYYVAGSRDGRIAIYRGLPEDVLGMSFREEIETSDTAVSDLPSAFREDVADAIEVDSLDEARATLQNLEQRAAEEEDEDPSKDRKRKDRS